MASKTLTFVLKQLIRHLCLNDYPCGNGSWRRVKNKKKKSDPDNSAESEEALLELLNFPGSPWGYVDDSWSPQAPSLRHLAVMSPECMNTAFIFKHFTKLSIVDKNVSVIDPELLMFSNLEELVLSINQISEVNMENLPQSLKLLDLRENQLSSLNSLTGRPPPQLQYLSLSANPVGLNEDVSRFTGKCWTNVVCLDLSYCSLAVQASLVKVLTKFSRLRTLLLEGNPLCLAPSYPGFVVDSLPRLKYLDRSKIFCEDRIPYRGLAKLKDLIVDKAFVKVNVERLRGLPEPITNEGTSPQISYKYYVTYEFFSHLDSNKTNDGESVSKTPLEGTDLNDIEVKPNKNEDNKTKEVENNVDEDEETPSMSRHSTQKLPWSSEMDFYDAQTYSLWTLRDLFKVLNHDLYVKVMEEKNVAWPAPDPATGKHNQKVNSKQRNSKASPEKPPSSKSKDKKRKTAALMVYEKPTRRILASTLVPLKSLIKDYKFFTVCNFGVIQSESETQQVKNSGKDRRKRKGAESRQRSHSRMKGKKHDNQASPTRPVPLMVDLNLELKKWRSTADATST